jgi:hypothetical protein
VELLVGSGTEAPLSYAPSTMPLTLLQSQAIEAKCPMRPKYQANKPGSSQAK